MNDRASVPHALLLKRSPTELARESDFRLGRTRVRPSILQVQRDGQAARTLEPRVMQVLVVLAMARGGVVSRSELIDRCWDGRVVGDNAINRVVSRLRQLAAGADFEIETIPRVGYRLKSALALPADGAEPTPAGEGVPAVPGGATAAAAPQPLPPPPTDRRRWLGAALAAGFAGGLGGAGWLAWDRSGWWAASRRGTRVAVLPFVALSEDERDKLLGVGMVDSLVARLSPVPGLVVRSTGSTLRYAAPSRDPLQAARELDVDWVVDGSLLRRDEQLRASTRLLRASDGVAIWSDVSDTRLAGLFDVQDQISAQVVQALAAALHLKLPSAPAGASGTRNPEAYQLYLAAIWRGQGHRREDLDHALRLLEQALALDPGFAMAWVGIAWTHRRGLWIDARPAEVFGPAEAALRRAAALAPGLAEMRVGRGITRYWYEYDWPGAEREFRAALAANPNAASAHYSLAQLLLTQDGIDQGLAHMRQAVELDPMSPVMSMVEASYLLSAGRREPARRRLDAALALAPNLWPMHVVLGQLLLAEGRTDDGIAALRRAAALGGGSSRPQAVLGAQLAERGQRDEARRLLVALEARSRERFVPPTSIAALYAALGQPGPALDALEQAVAVHEHRVVFLKDDPHWRALRGEPRFAALMKRLGLDRFGPGLSQV
ncbi:MAG TPA: winged helix-turn-helix domain-containing protein [Rubrivivax sp.]|nr:winged helix-turn-helix domain-containing protein [Rubrivivax sp.]